MTTQAEIDRQNLEMTAYRALWDYGGRAVRIEKRVLDHATDVYHVTQPKDEENIWCDCPGMKRQKYPRLQHKHVRVALDFVRRSQGQPEDFWAEYRFKGAGKNTKIRFLRDNQGRSL